MKNDIPKDILPTLVIGLGGTGFQIVKRLKNLFAKKYNGESLPIRYLVIDTDLKSFLDDDIENNEKCQLRFNEGIKSTLDWAYNNPNFQWLPKNPPIIPDFFTSTDQGAGLMRPIGRLYLCKNSKLVYDTLNSAKNSLVDLYKVLTEVGAAYLENMDRHKVYIVGSLAGGTGCGTFLDVSVMLSKIFNRDNTNLIGMFTLESCYDDKLSSDLDAQNRSKANCYAALKELEFYMASIKNPNDERYRFKYNNIGEIVLEKRLLDICYLVENKNENGGVLTSIENIYDLCSLQLFHEIGTKLGSQLRADYANFICKDKDPILKRDRHFSTFSSSSMEIPVDNIKKYCSYRLALDILQGLYNKSNSNIEEEVEEVIKNINDKIDRNNYFVNENSFKIKDASCGELSEALSKMNNLEKKVEEKRILWESNFEKNKEDITKVLSEYVNEKATTYGLLGLANILKRVSNNLKVEVDSIENGNTSISVNTIDKNIKSAIADYNKARKSKKESAEKRLNSCKSEVNTFVKENGNKNNYYITNSISNLVTDVIKRQLDDIDFIRTNIHKYKPQIERELQRIMNQANKKYGGNIISREMVSEEFYKEHYESTYGKHLVGIINQMMTSSNINEVFNNELKIEENLNILSLIRDNTEGLLRLCKYKVDTEDKIKNDTIIEILRKNAEANNKDSTSYIKEELDITAKLSKPFWSAIKNPEVSWTECYYIGSVRDENITNGFTIKPNEEIDKWIRSQMGEKSRQARYVETSNPYSIDVIHITMGACAAYLPEVHHYKQFYLKLLADQTYPLHLDEKYIGLDDLVKDVDELFREYTLSQAYGSVIKVGGKYINNLIREDNKFVFRYKSPYCLPIENVEIESLEEVNNISNIDEDLIIGEDEKQFIDNLSKNINLSKDVCDYINNVEKIYTKEELFNHKKKYIGSYKKEEVKVSDNSLIENKNGDFIAYEKLRFQNSFKKW